MNPKRPEDPVIGSINTWSPSLPNYILFLIVSVLVKVIFLVILINNY